MNTIPRYGIKTMYQEIPLDDGQYMVAEEVLPMIEKLQQENFSLMSENAKLRARVDKMKCCGNCALNDCLRADLDERCEECTVDGKEKWRTK